MNFANLIEINPVISSLNGLLVLFLNFIFTYILSLRFKLFNNSTLNFIFFNISIYFFISSILLFFNFIQN